MFNLYNFTKLEIASARRLARDGQKDAARQIFRYIRNGGIVDILKPIDFGQLPTNVALLEWELSQLEQEIHPSSVPDHTDTFTKLQSSLDVIAYGIQQLLSLKAQQ